MELKNRVCSLDLAKRLEKLKIKQDSHWWWRVYKVTGEAVITDDDYCKSNPGDYDHYAAFTFTELEEKIPYTFHYVKKGTNLHNIVIPHNVFISGINKCSFSATTAVNSIAEMICWLRENKFISQKT